MTNRPQPSPDVTFVIPVSNDAARLRQCLESIRANEPHVAGMEILVADNGSHDGSPETALSAGAKVLSLPGRSVGELRNVAASAAGGRVLAFVDADHVLDPCWIARALDTLAASGVVAVGAPYHAPPGGTWVQLAYDRFRTHDPGIRRVEWLGSGNLVVLRDDFLRVGGFDTSLETCEDVDLCNRLRAAGFHLLSDSRLISVHLGDPATLRTLFLGELWRGRDNIRVTLRGPLTFRALPSLLLPVTNLVFILLAMAGLLAMPWGGAYLLAAGLTGFSASVLLRTARMTRHGRSLRPVDVLANLVVASVYEAARALALVVRATYKTRRGQAADKRA